MALLHSGSLQTQRLCSPLQQTLLRGFLMHHWSQKLHRTKEHSVRSPPHEPSLLSAVSEAGQDSRFRASGLSVPSRATRMSPPALRRPSSLGPCLLILQAARFVPAFPGCHLRCSSLPLYFLLSRHLSQPIQKSLPAPSQQRIREDICNEIISRRPLTLL